MKRKNIFTTILLSAFLLASVAEAKMPHTSMPADALEMPLEVAWPKNKANSTTKLSELKGEKGTLVIFTCNECPAVKAWQDRIRDIGNEYQAKGISVVAINSNSVARNEKEAIPFMQERAESLNLQYLYARDNTSEIARTFGAERTPQVFLYDNKNTLVYHGAVDDTRKHKKGEKIANPFLRNALALTVEGKADQIKEEDRNTKALGCRIKMAPPAAKKSKE